MLNLSRTARIRFAVTSSMVLGGAVLAGCGTSNAPGAHPAETLQSKFVSVV
jgi:hypothetical protein